jgi:DNA polymerase
MAELPKLQAGRLVIDAETKGVIDLSKAGACRYAAHSGTAILCFAYTLDDEPVKLWWPGDLDPPPEFAAARVFIAHNAAFERAIFQHILTPCFGFPEIPIEQWVCTMARAQAMALPGKLKLLAEALSFEHGKASDGIMRRLSKPRKTRKGEDPNGIYWHDDAESLEKLGKYCCQDVECEREADRRLLPLSEAEQQLWGFDQRVNDYGFPIDRALVEAATRVAAAETEALFAEFRALTGLNSPEQKDKLKVWLADHSCVVINLKKPTVASALTRKGLGAEARRALKIRRDSAHAAANKPLALKEACSDDGRVRGTLIFHGAATGRWVGRGPQPQNFRRDAKDTDAKIAAVLSGDAERIAAFGAPVEVVGDISRGMICATSGCRFLIGDFTGIESVVLAAITGEQRLLEQWAKFIETQNLDDHPYLIEGRAIGYTDPDEAYAKGKINVLAFGFQGGLKAYRNFAPKGDTSTDAEIEARKLAWRARHRKIERFWYDINDRAVAAVRSPGTLQRHGKLRLLCENDFLRIKLLSGRYVCYPFPRIVQNQFGRDAVIFKDNTQGKWADYYKGPAYGGTYTENIVSATARDLLVGAMLRLEAAGYRIVLHVHDEVVCEMPDGVGSLEEFKRLIEIRPQWAESWPIMAKVRNGPRFSKSDKPAAESTSAEHVASPPPISPPPSPPPMPSPSLANGAGGGNGAAGGPAVAPSPAPAGASGSYPDSNSDTDKPYGPICSVLLRKGYRLARAFPFMVPGETAPLFTEDRYELPPGTAPTKERPRKTCRYWHRANDQDLNGTGPRRIVYGWPAIMRAGPGSWVFVVEGANKADPLIAAGLLATAAPYHQWGPECVQALAGMHVAYLEDHDHPDAKGRIKAKELSAAAEKRLAPAAASFRIVPALRLWKDLGRSGEPPHGWDVRDWIEQGGKASLLFEIGRENGASPSCLLQSMSAADVEMSGVDWMWRNRFAIGKLGIIAGLPDEGKGQVLCFIGAAVSTAGLWPCGEGHAPQGNVLLLSAEDDPSDTVVPRLAAAGADLSRITIVGMVREGGKDRMFNLYGDLEMLRQKIVSVGNVAAVLIDPISAYLGVGKIDSYRTTDVRAVLAPLVSLAEELKVAIIGILHFNKKLDVTNVLLRISDSLAYGATARHVYGVVNDPDNQRQLMVRAKNNLADRGSDKALAFSFNAREVGIDRTKGKPIVAPFIVWEQQYVDVTSTEAMQAANAFKSPTARDHAKRFLDTLLSSGPVISTEVYEAAEANGISRRTLHRAQQDLHIEVKKDGPTKDGERVWQWRLPDQKDAPG